VRLRHKLTIELEIVHNVTEGPGWFPFRGWCWVLAPWLHRFQELPTLRPSLDLTDIKMVS